MVSPSDTYDLMSYCRSSGGSADTTLSLELGGQLAKIVLRLDSVSPSPPTSRQRIAPSLPAHGHKIVAGVGGVDADEKPYLDPGVCDRRAARLRRTVLGPYRLEGRRTDGSSVVLRSRSQMPEIADGDGQSVFAFALPARPEWATELVNLVLTGPGGRVEMREGSEPPTVMAFDPQTGEIRAVLDDQAAIPSRPLTQRDFDRIVPQPGLDVRVSRGLPPAEDWLR